MARYLVKGAEFFLIEESGAVISLTRGYIGGTAIKRDNLIRPFLPRKAFKYIHTNRHKKEGFAKASRSFDPKPSRVVDLNEHSLKGARYLEHDGLDLFLEIAVRDGVLRARAGRIGGLGKTEIVQEGDDEALKARMKVMIDEAEEKGYKQLLAGPTFSLRVVSSELPEA